MLILTRRLNETIIIADNIEISIVDIKGDQVKVGINAPKSVKVFRKEVYDAIQMENKEAIKSSPTLPDLDKIVDDIKKES
jgi:carbon storage regulator